MDKNDAAPRSCVGCGRTFGDAKGQTCGRCRGSTGCPQCGQKMDKRARLCFSCTYPQSARRPMSDADWSWMAGIVEGEGFFSRRPAGGSVAVEMVDADVVDRLYEVSGVGYLGDRPSRRGYKPTRTWTVSRQDDAIWIAAHLYPLLSQRRRAQAKTVFGATITNQSLVELDAVAWLAGLIDGEGSISQQRYALHIRIANADVALLETVIRRFGGCMGPPHQTAPHHRPVYYWSATGRLAIDVAESIRPYMGVRRGTKIDQCLDVYRESPLYRKHLGVPKKLAHGTAACYIHDKCRCGECSAAAAAGDRRRRTSRRDQWVATHGPCSCGSATSLMVVRKNRAEATPKSVWSRSDASRAAVLRDCMVICKSCWRTEQSVKPLRGERIGTARLTSADVVDIKRLLGEGAAGTALAARYGVHKATINDIARGKTWRHVAAAVPRSPGCSEVA